MTALAFLYRWQLPILFVLLALVIVGPLLSPGYILTLDSTIAFNQDPFAHLFGLTSLPPPTTPPLLSCLCSLVER